MRNNESEFRLVQLAAAAIMGLALGLGLGSGIISSTPAVVEEFHDIEYEEGALLDNPPTPIQEITEDVTKHEEVASTQENIRSEDEGEISVIEESVKRAETFEGFEGEVYKLNDLCHIGYGHLTECDNPAILSMTEANEILYNDLVVVYDQLDAVIQDFDKVHPNIQVVLLDMGLNMGVAGLLKFEDMFAAFANNDLWGAMMAIEDSLYFEQVNSRAEANIDMLYVLLELQQEAANQPPEVSF